MASNSFGNTFRITTWGESHGRAVGVVIDGCPAGLPLSDADIQTAIHKRSPWQNKVTIPRKETDKAEIYSGVFEGLTTGTPISILIPNHDPESHKYEEIRDMIRPGHAQFSYLQKYGVFDHRGGGRSSSRETVSRVAAGAVAQKLLHHYGIKVFAHLVQAGKSSLKKSTPPYAALREQSEKSPFFCAFPKLEDEIKSQILEAKEGGDSLGGTVEFIAEGLIPGLGDPVYEKLEANLALAMLSIPASKGFEIGSGFHATSMQGSTHNDPFTYQDGRFSTKTNHAGGILGGISTGAPIIGRVAFKPTSSILREQESVDTQGTHKKFQLPEGIHWDPCIAVRAVPVVEAMCCLALADALLMNQSCRLSELKTNIPYVNNGDFATTP